jgi:protein TonB
MVTDNIQILQTTDYGASELKKRYQRFLSRGLIFAVVAHLVVIFVYVGILYIQARAEENVKKQQQQRIITVTDLEPPPSATDEDTPPPKPLEEILSAPPKDLTALEPEPVAKEKAQEQTIKTQEELEQIKTPVSSVGDTGKFVLGTTTTKVEEKTIEKTEKKEKEEVKKEIYKEFEVEKPPECVNLAQVRASMKYPEIAREAGVSGKVIAKVVVGPDGSVLKVRIVSGPEVFHSEVMDKAMNLQFTPGLQNGKPVKVEVTVPFNFQLKN